MVNRNFADLVVVAALAILAAVAKLLPIDNPAIVSLVALPLIFLLPGYSLMAAFFPKAGLGFPETLTFSIGLSLAADIVGGLAINLTPQGLAALPWTIFLASVTLGGCGVAALSRHRHVEPSPSWSGLGLSVGQILLLGLSVVVVAGALMLVRDPSVQPSASFTELWIRPASVSGQSVFDVGIRNSEPGEMAYRLEVKAGRDLVDEYPSITLSPGETWERVIMFQIPENGNVQAFLYRTDSPTAVYRQVVLWGAEQ
jgi:uncharacterized membrane protein